MEAARGKADIPHDENSLLVAADEIGTKFEALFMQASFNDSGEARISACLLLTIAELYIAVLAVLRSPAQSHAGVLIRSMLEALADLNNLVADPNYLDQMHFDNADQMLKTSQGFLDDADLRDDPEVQENMKRWRAIEQEMYDKLKSKGCKPQGPAAKFKLAKMIGEYATGYRFLCSFSHSDLNTLIARHAGDGQLRFTDTLPPETLKSLLGLAISIYARSVNTLPKYSNLSTAEVQSACDAADSIWSTL